MTHPSWVPGFFLSFRGSRDDASEWFFLQTCAVVSGGDVRKGLSACWSLLCLTFHGGGDGATSSPGRKGTHRSRRGGVLCSRLSRRRELPMGPRCLRPCFRRTCRGPFHSCAGAPRTPPWCPGLDYSRSVVITIKLTIFLMLQTCHFIVCDFFFFFFGICVCYLYPSEFFFFFCILKFWCEFLMLENITFMFKI